MNGGEQVKVLVGGLGAHAMQHDSRPHILPAIFNTFQENRARCFENLHRIIGGDREHGVSIGGVEGFIGKAGRAGEAGQCSGHRTLLTQAFAHSLGIDRQNLFHLLTRGYRRGKAAGIHHLVLHQALTFELDAVDAAQLIERALHHHAKLLLDADRVRISEVFDGVDAHAVQALTQTPGNAPDVVHWQGFHNPVNVFGGEGVEIAYAAQSSRFLCPAISQLGLGLGAANAHADG